MNVGLAVKAVEVGGPAERRASSTLPWLLLLLCLAGCSNCSSKPSVCNAHNCLGCCDTAGHCNLGDEPALCGAGGATCARCAPGDACAGGQCVAGNSSDGGGGDAGPAPCGILNCTGCCADDGGCVSGTDVNACGGFGARCSACPPTLSCVQAQCLCVFPCIIDAGGCLPADCAAGLCDAGTRLVPVEQPLAFQVSGGSLFWSTRGNQLATSLADGGGAQTLIASGLSDPVAFTVSGGSIYVANAASGAADAGWICQWPGADGGCTPIAAGLTNPHSILTLPGLLVWGDDAPQIGPGGVDTLVLNTGQLFHDGLDFPSGLTTGGAWIFLSTSTAPPGLWRVTPRAFNPVRIYPLENQNDVPGVLTTDSTYVFLVDASAPHTLFGGLLDGALSVTVPTETGLGLPFTQFDVPAVGLVSDTQTLFVALANGEIRSVPVHTNSGPAAQKLVSCQAGLVAIAQDGSNLYWARSEDAALGGGLYVLPKPAIPGLPPTPDAGSDAGAPSCAPDAGYQTDPLNCGACGHGCLGGACVAGQCQQVEVAPLDFALAFQVDGGVAYLTTGDDALLSVALSSGIVTSLTVAGLGRPVSLAVWGQTAWVANLSADTADSGFICQWSPGMPACVSVAGSASAPFRIIADDDFVYWDDKVPSGLTEQNAIHFLRPATGALVNATFAVPNTLVSQGGYLYEVPDTNDGVDRQSTWNFVDSATYSLPSGEVPGPFTVDATDIYLGSASSSELFTVSLGGGAILFSPWVSLPAQVVDLKSDGSHVYCALSNGDVWSVPTVSNILAPLVLLAHGHNGLTAVAFDEQAVYWIDSSAAGNGGGLYRVAKPVP